jgi:hypothetical protein
MSQGDLAAKVGVYRRQVRRYECRWVDLSYDGPIITGWGSLTKTEDEVVALMSQRCNEGKVRMRIPCDMTAVRITS